MSLTLSQPVPEPRLEEFQSPMFLKLSVCMGQRRAAGVNPGGRVVWMENGPLSKPDKLRGGLHDGPYPLRDLQSPRRMA